MSFSLSGKPFPERYYAVTVKTGGKEPGSRLGSLFPRQKHDPFL